MSVLTEAVTGGILRNFAKFTGKHFRQRLFLNEVADLRPVILFKKCLWHRCSPVNFGKFLRTPFYRKPPDNSFCFETVCGLSVLNNLKNMQETLSILLNFNLIMSHLLDHIIIRHHLTQYDSET